MVDSSSFVSDWVSPPGDTIEDLLEELGWTHNELAERLGVSAKHVTQLLKGNAPITPETADRLSRVLGSTSEFWLVRDARYRAALQRHGAASSRASDAEWLNQLPLAWMIRQGWINSGTSVTERVEACLRYFNVATVDAWQATYGDPLAAFRASPTFERKIGPVASWLRRGEREATALTCASYQRPVFKDSLGKLRGLTTATDPKEFVPRLIEECARCGVAVVFAPAPPGCPASGATRWLSPDKAMLLLSLRHRTNDHLWFTIFHEAAHILFHSKKLQFVDGCVALDRETEDEADRCARDCLIPPSDARRLKALVDQHAGRLSALAVKSFARDIGIAPGIVVGRLQNEKWLPWSHLNDLKVKYTWAESDEAEESDSD